MSRMLATLGLLAVLSSGAAAQDFRISDSIVTSGIRQGIYPGAVLVIGRKAGVLHQRGFGHLTWQANAPVPSPDSTLWDLASLTKVIGTTGAVMRLVEEERLDLEQPVVRYLPRFRGADRAAITVRMLLNHTSGLPSYREFFRLAATRDSAIALLYTTPLRHRPGTTVEYSDLNFLLLGLLVEQLSGEPLERYVQRAVLVPAGMQDSRYRPTDAAAMRTAPTGEWHGHPVCCVVNDQNAARFGGAAGHAGLFSSGADLSRFARLWLNGGTLDGRQVFRPATLQTFLTPDSADATRLLGWERPPSALGDKDCRRPACTAARREDSAYGTLLSSSAFGHTGWTGTLIWVDPGHDLFLILLTNRSYAPRIGHSIRALRAVRGALADAVIRAIDAPGLPRTSPGP
jgi:CubicO group peptidase (beta-lactamase class C family)